MDVKLLGERIRAMRHERGLKQDELAGLVGISAAYISRLENGAVPNPKWLDLLRITDTLGIPVGALVTGGTEMDPARELADYLTMNPELLLALRRLLLGYAWATGPDKRMVNAVLEALASRLDTSAEEPA